MALPPTSNGQEVLTPFQIELSRTFFSLPSSQRFLLAGGAALLAQHLSVRPTQDLDLFTRQQGDVRRARDELVTEAAQRGTIEVQQDNEDFCRLVVHGPEDMLVDLALESPPTLPPTAAAASATAAASPSAAPRTMAPAPAAASAAASSLDATALARSLVAAQLQEPGRVLQVVAVVAFIAFRLGLRSGRRERARWTGGVG